MRRYPDTAGRDRRVIVIVLAVASISGASFILHRRGYDGAILDLLPTSPTFSATSIPAPSPQPGPFTLIPPERLTTWTPGIPGGIPARATVCANVSAASYGNGALDATAGIQAALDACPVEQVVQLSTGDFKITQWLQISKGIVLRGMGPAQTKLKM